MDLQKHADLSGDLCFAKAPTSADAFQVSSNELTHFSKETVATFRSGR